MKYEYNGKQILIIKKKNEYEKLAQDKQLEEDKYLYYKVDICPSTIQSRCSQLELMHKFCCMANDENIAMNWLMGGVPDGADVFDYLSIASDESLYKDTCECFQRQVAKEGWKY